MIQKNEIFKYTVIKVYNIKNIIKISLTEVLLKKILPIKKNDFEKIDKLNSKNIIFQGATAVSQPPIYCGFAELMNLYIYIQQMLSIFGGFLATCSWRQQVPDINF